jgi:recX family
MAFRIGKDREWTLETAMEQALRLLGPRDLSTLELRRKLSQRSVPNELIQEVEETLLDLSYIDDEQLAEDALRAYMEAEKYSTYYIREKMRERGLIVSYALDDYDEWSVAVKLLEQRFSMSDESRLEAIEQGEEDKFNKKKIIYFLKNRGFAVSTIQSICNEWGPYLE